MFDFSNGIQLSTLLAAAAAVVYVVYTQLTWRPVSSRALWRFPASGLILGVAGLQGTQAVMNGGQLGLTALELALSVGMGVLAGALTKLRSATPKAIGKQAAKDRERARREAAEGHGTVPRAPLRFESRSGLLVLCLLVAVLALRFGLMVLAKRYLGIGFDARTMSALIWLMLAAYMGSRALMVSTRAAKLPLPAPETAPAASAQAGRM
ncbi:MAG: hypothetical protein LBM66_03915 [Bifidobacteriaceae bacterium]|jgi:hypothetical protein|nr:hypothetical protein [Bifidobacteriaceae bacterium]